MQLEQTKYCVVYKEVHAPLLASTDLSSPSHLPLFPLQYELSARAGILEQLKLKEDSDVFAGEPVVCGLLRRAAEPQASTVSCQHDMSNLPFVFPLCIYS